MNVFFDGDHEQPEIEFSGNLKQLRSFGQNLLRVHSSFQLHLTEGISEYYPEAITSVSFNLLTSDMSSNGKLKILLHKKEIFFEGSEDAFNKLGRSLLNFFDEDSVNGDHIHFSYIEGDPLLAPTECSIIIVLSL